MNLTLIFGIFFALIAINFAQQQLTQSPQQPPQQQPQNLPAQPPQNLPAQPLPTLSQELHSLMRFIPQKRINRLFNRYLLQDAEFQAIIRIINSRDAYLAFQRFKMERESMAFISWLNTQILPTDESLELFESFEDFKIFLPFNTFWMTPTGGLRGLANELSMFIPLNTLYMQIQQRRLQNPAVAQLLTNLQQLERPFACLLNSTNGQNIDKQLSAAGLNTTALNNGIRNFFGWNGTAVFNCDVIGPSYGFGNLFSNSPSAGVFDAPAVPPMEHYGYF